MTAVAPPASIGAMEGFEENQRGRLAPAQVKNLRSKGRADLVGAAGLVLMWGLLIAGVYALADRFSALMAAVVGGLFLLGMAALLLRRSVFCLLDARSPPSMVEGRLEMTRHHDRRGRSTLDLRVDGERLIASEEQWDAIIASEGTWQAYCAPRSRRLVSLKKVASPTASRRD